MTPKVKLSEIAQRIDAHLKRFERDKVINQANVKYHTTPYHQACAWAAGGWVGVRYVAYQGNVSLTRQQAVQYLEWLDAGNVGKHWNVEATCKR